MDRGTKTRYPGVYKISDRIFWVRAYYTDPKTGKREEKTGLLEGNIHEAVIDRRRMAGEKVVLGREKTGDYAKRWIKRKEIDLDPQTGKRYVSALEKVLDHFGEFFVDTISRSDIQAWVDRYMEAGRAPDTVRGWFAVFRTMLRDAAIEFDLKDITTRIKLPAPRPRKNSFSREELVAFLAEWDKFPQHRAVVWTTALTGLRWCHVSALAWRDVDLAEGVLVLRNKHARGAVSPISRHKQAPEVYPLPEVLIALLSAHKKQNPGLPAAWVFPSRVGTPRNPSSVQKPWKKCMTAAEITGGQTVHDLRRTFINRARAAGIDKTTARTLTGQSEATHSSYSGVGMSELRSAVGTITEFAFRNRNLDRNHEAENESGPADAATSTGPND